MVWAGRDILQRDFTPRTHCHISPMAVRTTETAGLYFIHSFSDDFLTFEVFNDCRKVGKGTRWSSFQEKGN